MSESFSLGDLNITNVVCDVEFSKSLIEFEFSENHTEAIFFNCKKINDYGLICPKAYLLLVFSC